jgi:hypothetical protein
MIAQQLAGRGAVVEVLEPASVRSEPGGLPGN